MEAVAPGVVVVEHLRRTGERPDVVRPEDRPGLSAEALRAVMDAVVEGVVFQEPLGRVVAMNSQAEELLGMTREELTGETWFTRAPFCVREDGAPFPGEEHPAMVTLRTGEPSDGTVMGVEHPDGSVRWITISSRPLASPDVPVTAGAVTVFREVAR